ncbi:hypothetical protein [Ancylobacter defluvii]|uniref:Uncharacterized protein n=1 Tax=Ancylobacter defluvii TaxID=1282440 RepID=A0A9W6K1U8_9HYPH|nr:hypothetical protein [Ancylobacter defluvii]MBS7588280.1 hypothetical protein [Ancylobacter defluvii]GLK86676.1 hypothetical protein GCM10017653_47460 [Ancylobacter defluvii]
MEDERLHSDRASVMDAVRLGLAAVGTALIGYGAWLHYPPLGFVAAGILIYAVALIGALRSRA